MGHLHSWSDVQTALACDASVWINLEATTRIELIIRSFSRRFVITETALRELERGRKNGRMAADAVSSLISVGLVDVVTLQPEHEETFLGLVSGKMAQTLDDGEAATLAYAHGAGAVAIIDERKATSIAGARFPQLSIASTTDILLAPSVRSTLAGDDLSDAFFCALTSARMRVPEVWLETVSTLLGRERLQQCCSIPERYRIVPLEAQKVIAKI